MNELVNISCSGGFQLDFPLEPMPSDPNDSRSFLCKAVILIFSVSKSGGFQGYARMPGGSRGPIGINCDPFWPWDALGILGVVMT